MKIAVIGTGMVGRGLAARLAELGHEVVIGTRDPERTLARAEPDMRGNLPYSVWQADNPGVRLMSFPEAGAHAELVVNATAGAISLEALEAVGAEHLSGKILLDLALPLDRSAGMPPTLLYAHTDSLGEKIQRSFPEARVVKSLSTVYFKIMIEPSRIPGRHNIFIAGDNAAAKEAVKGILHQFGWPEDSIMDLGGIYGARATEMYAQLSFTLAHVLGDFDFNIAVVRA